jgi:hypothetical protein
VSRADARMLRESFQTAMFSSLVFVFSPATSRL